MSRRLNRYSVLYVPTLKILDDEQATRHIIWQRDGEPICGAAKEGEQEPPSYWDRKLLCAGCIQKYIRRIEGLDQGGGWGLSSNEKASAQ